MTLCTWPSGPVWGFLCSAHPEAALMVPVPRDPDWLRWAIIFCYKDRRPHLLTALGLTQPPNYASCLWCISWHLPGFCFLSLFLERKGGRKRGKETLMCFSVSVRETSIGCLLHTPNWGPGLQPRHVPSWGIEPATSQFAGWRSIYWATPARAQNIFKTKLKGLCLK